MADDERLRGELYAVFELSRAIEARGREISAETWQPGREGCRGH